MININSALLEQASSLLDEHNIDHKASEAPSCASLSFGSDALEIIAIKLLEEHFGTVILGARKLDNA